MAQAMRMSLDLFGAVSTNSSTNIVPLYESYPAKKLFEDLEEYIDISEVPVQSHFKLAWYRLTGQVKSWAKLNVQPGIYAMYGQLKETLELALSDSNCKWALKTELYGKSQEKCQDSLQFLMRKLKISKFVKYSNVDER